MPLQPGSKPNTTPATLAPTASTPITNASAPPITPATVTIKPHPTKDDKVIVCDGETCKVVSKSSLPPATQTTSHQTESGAAAASGSAPQTPLSTGNVVVDQKAGDQKGSGLGSGSGVVGEPLLVDDKNRYILFPIQHWDLFTMYKKALASFWTVEEVDLGQDMKDWDTLTSNEQYFIKHVLAFFASADLLVMDNLAARFMNDVSVAEAKCFYSAQIMQESIHSEMYGLLLDTYVKDTVEKAQLFNAVETLPAIKAKAQWALKWMASDRSFAERLLAFACVEGVGFSGSFCSIFWLKKRGKMPGLTFSNELISRDESLHTDFATMLFRKLNNRPSQKTVEEIVVSAVDAEKAYVCESLPVALIGMNSDSMSQYIEFVADRLLDALGYSKVYNVANPFDWMEMLSLQGKSNFFEKRVGEYQRANVMSQFYKRMQAATNQNTPTAPTAPTAPTPDTHNTHNTHNTTAAAAAFVATSNRPDEKGLDKGQPETLRPAQDGSTSKSAATAPPSQKPSNIDPAAFVSELDC